MNLTLQSDIASTCNQMVMTMIHDALERPYLYVANKEAGLKVYDITSPSSPLLLNTIATSSFDTLDVMNLSQQGDYLYLALGNSFTNPQQCGMAIVDVTNPALSSVTDFYVVPNSSSGGGIVKVEGNYAYLGAMQSGLVILDVTNKNSIQFVSKLVPEINFPPINNPNPSLYNARGMEVKNSVVYLCYDAGGVRIINCTNKSAPVETGHWCNPLMYNPVDHPKAYNNVVLDDTLLYVTVDYCGMEAVNIADTSNITLAGWWNPYNCPNNNWFTSPVHANEIFFNKICEEIFLAVGKSDLIVLDVSDPAHPDSCNFYGGIANSIGTWGVSSYANQIYLSYICAAIPFTSNSTGIKILTYDTCSVTGINDQSRNTFSVYPNPCTDKLTVDLKKMPASNYEFLLFDPTGRMVLKQNLYSKKQKMQFSLAEGLYFYVIKDKMQEVGKGKIILRQQ